MGDARPADTVAVSPEQQAIAEILGTLNDKIESNRREGIPSIGIGDGSVIENAIVDKNARIGPDVRIVNEAGVQEAEESRYCVIRDGVVVVPKFTIIEAGRVI